MEILQELNPDMPSPLFEDERAGDIHTSSCRYLKINVILADGRIDLNKGGLVMKIVWLSSRVLGSDLCSTTQIQSPMV